MYATALDGSAHANSIVSSSAIVVNVIANESDLAVSSLEVASFRICNGLELRLDTW